MSSPYHPGEIAIQTKAGLREQANDLAGMYRDALPASVAEFLTQHTFGVLSSEDANGNLWASPLTGPAGIFSVPDDHSVRIHLDRLDPRIDAELARGKLAGLLVIHFDQRLRIRINGTAHHAANTLTLRIAQFYGNCTKYIQRRIPAPEVTANSISSCLSADRLTDAQRAWIARSDTFFIASRHPESGTDASHRGGRPGFVTAPDERTIVFPDYRGNNMFNTLGNLEVEPRASLLFIDFESGASLQLTGNAAVQWPAPSVAAPTGRAIRFEIVAVRELAPSSALRYSLVEPFPYNPPVE